MKQFVSRQGLIATFMAKWNQHLPGCGGHLHQSLWDPKLRKNLFSDARNPDGMSSLMKNLYGRPARADARNHGVDLSYREFLQATCP